jgi:gliding motility-associated-like protein
LKRLIFLIILLASSGSLWAQINSCPDQFKAYNSSGQEITQFCVGQLIRFKSCLPNTEADKEYYDFDKSNNVNFSTDTTKSFTYTKAGTYTVTQLINTGTISQKERTFVVTDTPPPAFTVKACAQNQVSVTIKDTNYDIFRVDFCDGTTLTLTRGASALHQYAAGAPLKVRVIASYTGSTCSGQAEVAVSPLPAPSVPVLESSKITVPGQAGKVSLNIRNLQPAYLYVLERITNGSATPIDTLKNPATPTLTYPINNINTANPMCFRVRVTDNCGSNLNLSSDLVCTQPLAAATGNNQVILTWPAYPNNSNQISYALYRNGTLLQTLSPTQNSYTDADVVCGTKYCYSLTANLKDNRTAASNDTCVTAVTTLAPPAGTLSSTFNADNQVILTFKVPGNNPAKLITYQKSTANSPFSVLAATDKIIFTDTAIPDKNQWCYQAFYEDNCGKSATISNITCPILLTGSISPDGTINLEWSEYVGFTPGGAQYQLERVDATGTVLSVTPVSGTTYREKINSPEQQHIFRLQATHVNQTEKTYSNILILRQDNSFRIPTAFSPNGDGLNDFFVVKGKIFGSFRLQVLDRWGQVIFVSTNPQIGWNGQIKGQDAPVGVYVYSLTTADSNGRPINKTGSFTLVK